jgi:hypothetical protein
MNVDLLGTIKLLLHLEEREFLEQLSNCKALKKMLHHVLGFLWLKVSVIHDFSFGVGVSLLTVC